MALSENSRKIFDYVKANDGTKTANDIAEATGLSSRSVNGSITSAFQKKGLMERVLAEMELPDGTHKQVNLIKLTPAGLAFDPDAPDAE